MIDGFGQEDAPPGQWLLTFLGRLLDFVSQLLGLAGRLLRLPVEIVLAVVTWFVYKVCGDIGALPFVLALGVGDAIARVRTRLELRRITLRIEAEQHIATQARLALFYQVVNAVEQLDRDLAQIDPHFAESLAAAQAVYQQQVAALVHLASDPSLRERVDAILAGRDGDAIAS